MTKILATTQPDSVGKSQNPQKSGKTEEEVYTVIKPTILPISIPHTTVVKKERKCRLSWIIGLILLLWVLATLAIIFHLAPDCVYRKLHQLSRHSEPRLTTTERFVFDIAEPDIKIAPKLPQISASSNIVDGTAQEPLNKQMTIDGDASEPLRQPMLIDGDITEPFRKELIVDGSFNEPLKQRALVEGTAGQESSDNETVPDEDDATSAIRTLLKRPEVQQVVIVGRSEDSPGERPPKGVIVIDGSMIGESGAKPSDIVNQLQNNRGVVIPAEQLIGDGDQPFNPVQLAIQPPEASDSIREQNVPISRPVVSSQTAPLLSPEYQQEVAKYQQALIQWQMQREIYRRQLLMRMQRERALAAESEMPNFLMGPPPPHRHRMMMMYRMPMPIYHMMFPPPQQPTPQISAEVPSPENAPHDGVQIPRGLDNQFPVQMEPKRQSTIPQQEVSQPLEQSRIPETPELPMVRPHDASADQIFAAMQANPKIDRDAIFRRFLAQSQAENLRQEQQEQSVESSEQPITETRDGVFWKMQRIAQDMSQRQETADEDAVSKQEKTHDEIFRELQQQSLELQREADAKEFVESIQPKQELKQTTPEKSTTEMPVIMIADSFPRRSTVAEPEQKIEEQSATTATPFEEATSDQSVPSTPRTDPLADFFRFFENEAVKLSGEFHPTKDIATFTAQSTTQAPEGIITLDETSGMEVDQPEPAEGTSPIETETSAPHSTVTQEIPLATNPDEPIILEVKDEQALLNNWRRDQDPVIEVPERPIVRIVE